MRCARADRTKATNGAQTTYGQTAAEFAVDELAANVDELLDDLTDPADEAPMVTAPRPDAALPPDATLPTGDDEPFYAGVTGVTGVTEPDIDDLAADPSALFDDEEDLL